MRIVLVSVLAIAVAACSGGGESGNSASGPDGVSTTTTGKLTLGEDGVPKFKPGLWEMTAAEEGKPAETTKSCLGEDSNESVREAVTREFDKECKVDRRSGSEGIYIKASCPMNGMDTDALTEIKGSDENFEMKVEIDLSMPDGSKHRSAIAAKGRWIGECPAGMKPGDEVGGDSNDGE